jgi:plastocyanin
MNKFNVTNGARAAACWCLIATALTAGCNRRTSSEPRPDKSLYTALRAEFEAGAGGSGGAAVVAADPEGWATLKGKFTVSGSVPQRKALKVDKDEATCAPGGKTVFDQDVVVGPNGELANVLIFLTTKTPDDPKWINNSYDATKTATVEFDQKKCVFLNRVFAMRSTQTIKIMNSDSMSHNTNLSPKAGAKPFNGNVPPMSSVLHAIGGEEPGAFPVACNVHPWMKAWMISRNNPYFAVSKADGTFEIRDLPAGVDLEFRVWQENAQFLEKVTLNGTATPWPKGRYKVKLKDKEDVNIDVTVSADVFK